MDKLPGGWKPETNISLDKPAMVKKISVPLENVIVIDNFLSDLDCEKLISLMNSSPNLEAVGINGFMDNADESNIGSRRTTMWVPQLANEVWNKLDQTKILTTRIMNEQTPTDWWQNDKSRTKWQPYGASPMMRFMRYEKMGQHYAHYDAGFIYEDDNYRTLMSYVIYLTDCEEGGSTRFIKDDQQDTPVWERKHDDWTREANEDEVIFGVQPKKGSILIFDHRLCHDVEQYMGSNPRIIIRGDVIFKSC